MNLIPEWRDVWRWYSTWVMAALAAMPVVWATIPYEWQMAVPDGAKYIGAALMFFAGVLGRVVKQDRRS